MKTEQFIEWRLRDGDVKDQSVANFTLNSESV